MRSVMLRSNESFQAAPCFPADLPPDFDTLEVGVLVQICDVSGLRNSDGTLLDGGSSSVGKDDDAGFELPVAERSRLL